MPITYPPYAIRKGYRQAYRLPYRLPGGVQSLIAEALVDLNGDNLTSSGGNLATLPNSGRGGDDYSFTVPLGTAANCKPHPSGSCLLFGASGDYASTPDSVANSITGDIDIRALGASDAWGDENQTLVAKHIGSSDNRSYWLYVQNTTASIILQISTDGESGGIVLYTSTVAPAFVNGEQLWVRAALDVDNGAGDSECTFYTSADGVTWDQLGDPVNSGSTVSIYDGAAEVSVGSINEGGGNWFAGTIYRAQIYNGIDGTLAVDFNPLDCPNTGTTTFDSSTTGEEWTLNGNSFIQNSGHLAAHSIGSFGIETTAGQSITNPYTVFVVGRFSDPSPSANNVFFQSRSDNGARPAIYSNEADSDKFSIFQGSGGISLSEDYDNLPHVFTGEFNGDATTKLTVPGVGFVAGSTGSDNWDFGTLFANSAGGNTLSGYIVRMLVYPRAFSAAEIAILENYFQPEYNL